MRKADAAYHVASNHPSRTHISSKLTLVTQVDKRSIERLRESYRQRKGVMFTRVVDKFHPFLLMLNLRSQKCVFPCVNTVL